MQSALWTDSARSPSGCFRLRVGLGRRRLGLGYAYAWAGRMRRGHRRRLGHSFGHW